MAMDLDSYLREAHTLVDVQEPNLHALEIVVTEICTKLAEISDKSEISRDTEESLSNLMNKVSKLQAQLIAYQQLQQQNATSRGVEAYKKASQDA